MHTPRQFASFNVYPDQRAMLRRLSLAEGRPMVEILGDMIDARVKHHIERGTPASFLKGEQANG